MGEIIINHYSYDKDWVLANVVWYVLDKQNSHHLQRPMSVEMIAQLEARPDFGICRPPSDYLLGNTISLEPTRKPTKANEALGENVRVDPM